jgi:hypothetical protein
MIILSSVTRCRFYLQEYAHYQGTHPRWGAERLFWALSPDAGLFLTTRVCSQGLNLPQDGEHCPLGPKNNCVIISWQTRWYYRTLFALVSKEYCLFCISMYIHLLVLRFLRFLLCNVYFRIIWLLSLTAIGRKIYIVNHATSLRRDAGSAAAMQKIWTGRPDEIVKNSAPKVAQTIFVKNIVLINTYVCTYEKVA